MSGWRLKPKPYAPKNPMKNHTPGPWIETPTTGNPSNPDTLRMDVVTTSGEWAPAFVCGDMLPEDARLIACAPDLLSALEAVVEWLESAQADQPDDWEDPAMDSAVESARAAIAKAKGGEL